MPKAKRPRARSRRNAEARPEEGGLLLSVFPLLWPLLGAADRKSLRACCHATRQRADCLLDELRFSRPELHFTSPGALSARWSVWRGAVARGARPRRLVMEVHPWQWDTRGAPEAGLLRLLADLAALQPPALADVRLSRLPLTTAVVRALAAAAPQLSVLHLSRYDLSTCDGGVRGRGKASKHARGDLASRPSVVTLRGVQGLLRHAAPHLGQLAISCQGAWAAARWLPPLLQLCTRLTCLSLSAPPGGAALAALGQLPSLRSLTLSDPRGGKPTALPRLSRLSALTQLTLDCSCDAALPAVAQLRALARLELPRYTLRPEGLQLLAGLTALTQLTVRELVVPRQCAAAEAAARAGGAAVDESPDPRAPGTQPLPPRLERLEMIGSAHPAELVALRIPPSLTDLHVGRHCEGRLLRHEGGVCPNEPSDVDEEGRLLPAAAEALLAACRLLVGRTRTASICMSRNAPPLSWHDRYGTLFAALQPAALTRMVLQFATLEAADVAALVVHLPTLEVLHLPSDVPLHAWPFLSRLERLRELRLRPGLHNSVEAWEDVCEQAALRAALLALCVEAPRLERLELAPLGERWDESETEEVAQEARDECRRVVPWLGEMLPRLRADPPEVCLLVDTYYGCGCGSEH